MHVLVTCIFDKDSIKNEGAIMSLTFSPLHLYRKIVRCPRASNSLVNCPIRPEIKINCDFMPVLVTR